MQDDSPRQRSVDYGDPKTLRKIFELKDPEERKAEEKEEKHSAAIASKNDNPFFRDPLILPKVNRHLRVGEG